MRPLLFHALVFLAMVLLAAANVVWAADHIEKGQTGGAIFCVFAALLCHHGAVVNLDQMRDIANTIET